MKTLNDLLASTANDDDDDVDLDDDNNATAINEIQEAKSRLAEIEDRCEARAPPSPT
jgi:hypothetical protein